MSNYRKLIASALTFGLCTAYASGTFFNNFLLHYGISESNVSLFATVMLICQIASLLFSYFFADKLFSPKNWTAFAKISFLLIIISVFIINNFVVDTAVILILIFTSGVLVFFFYGIFQALDYKIPLMVMNKEKYARYVSVCGMIAQLGTIVFSIIMSFLQNLIDYRAFVNIAMGIAALACLLSGYFVFSLKVNKKVAELSQSKKIKKIKVFYPHFIPDLLRGFSSGIAGLVILFATIYGISDDKISTYYVTISSISLVVGSFFTLLLSRKSEKLTIFISSIFSSVIFVLMFLIKNPYLFLAVAFVRSVIFCVEGLFVPIFISKVIHREDLGAYAARKAIVSAAGSAIATLVMGIVFGLTNASSVSYIMIIISSVLELASGFMYLLIKFKNKSDNEADLIVADEEIEKSLSDEKEELSTDEPSV